MKENPRNNDKAHPSEDTINTAANTRYTDGFVADFTTVRQAKETTTRGLWTSWRSAYDPLQAPGVASHVPLSDATGVAVGANVTVVFDSDMDASTIDNTTITIRKDGAGSDTAAAVTFVDGTRTATLNPSSNLDAASDYHVTVHGEEDGVMSEFGEFMPADVTFTFTTA